MAAVGGVADPIAFDPPGFGLSTSGDDPSPERLADRYATAAELLGIGQAVVIGIGTGGLLALQLARRHPELVGAVALIGMPSVDLDTRRQWAGQLCPDLSPDPSGDHVARAWGWRRSERMFFPWFQRTEEHYRPAVLDAAALEDLHEAVIDSLAAGLDLPAAAHAWLSTDPDRALDDCPAPVLSLPAADDPAFDPAELVELLRRHPGRPAAGLPAADRPAAGLPAADRPAAGRPAAGSPAAGSPKPAAGPPGSASFAATPAGQIAVRRWPGNGRPLVLLHSSPGGGEALVPLASALSRHRPVLVLDTIGNGDSAKPDLVAAPQFRAPQIADYAAVALSALDDLGVDAFDVYGTHTGALIAVEMAIKAGSRVGSVVLDGVPLPAIADPANGDPANGDTQKPPAEPAPDGTDPFADHFVDLTPRWDGGHLLAAWWYVCDSRFWYPWNQRTPQTRTDRGYHDVPAVHRLFVQLLRSGTTYPLAYRAALQHRTRQRLPEVTTRTAIVRRTGEVLDHNVMPARQLLPNGCELPTPDTVASVAETLQAWLDD